jgi:cyclomaltodextrinase / maltogenic alpha-amylase / neopullulanase
MTVPTWAQDAIFYQIFPDRFNKGRSDYTFPNMQPWGSKPSIHGFQGGDLQGIIQKMDYLQDLGINALYLNPIFRSPSNHRYNTSNYYEIDPKLGTLDDFKLLLRESHQRNIRIILDGVFNHTGRGFFAFNDIIENQQYSPYLDWFIVNRFPIDAYSPGEAKDYLGWWKYKSLPKLNYANPKVRKFFLDVARYWVDLGTDGWRLDVPNEIDDDPFWADFRRVVKAANPDAYLVGEIWEVDSRWVGDTHFDGLMNYPLRVAVLDMLMDRINAQEFGNRVERLLDVYPKDNTLSMFNLLSSHDTERIFTLSNQDIGLVKLGYAFLMAYVGSVSIFYGDEIGLQGGKDPDCRRAFPWNPDEWKKELRTYLQKLIQIRKQYPALRGAGYQRLDADNPLTIYAMARSSEAETVVCIFNTDVTEQPVSVKVFAVGWENGQTVKDLLGGGTMVVEDGAILLSLPSYATVLLAKQ